MKKTWQLKHLFETYQTDLLRYIASKFGDVDDAEDVVQETFHKVLTADNLSSIENPRAYLYTAANNLALNRLEKERRHQDYLVDNEEGEVPSPDRAFQAQKELESLEAALMELPVKYRRTFLLSRVQHKSYVEISRELNIAVSTVEKHVIKVLRHLRSHLDEEGGL